VTLAIIEGLLVRVADARYAIPLTAVEECVELSDADSTRSKGAASSTSAANWCHSCACANCSTSPRPDAHQKVVIVAAADTRVGLVVDQIIAATRR